MGGQRLGGEDRGVPGLLDRAQGVEVAEVELVDACASRPVGWPTRPVRRGRGSARPGRRARASSRMPSVARIPMPSWLARKLNQVAVSLTGPTPAAQSLQPRGGAGDERVQHQRRQRELVDEVGLVVAVAEVGDVLGVRNVGLGEQPRPGRDLVDEGPPQLDDGVGLRQVQARRAGLLPEEPDRVQPDRRGAADEVAEQHVGELEQGLRVCARRRRPGPRRRWSTPTPRAVRAREGVVQRRGPGPDHRDSSKSGSCST